MPRIFGNPARVDRVVKKGNPTAPPILSVSVGSAGASCNWRFLQRMTDAGRLSRIASAIICDYNVGTVSRMRQRIRSRRGRHISQVVLPETIYTADGFLLNPYGFGHYLGTVDADLNRLVDQVRNQSQDGSQPQIILEFLGFGGHAIVGLLLHMKLQDAFPEARFLPVIALPADEMLHDWMRREVREPPPGTNLPAWMRQGTWDAYETCMRMGPYDGSLMVDNRIDAAPNDDLALGLAVIEAAGTDPMKRGSLPEAVSGVRLDGRGWLGMNVVRRVVPSRRSYTLGFPLRRRRPVWSGSNELGVQTKAAIIACLTDGSLLERHGNGREWEDPLAAMPHGRHANGGNPPPAANGATHANGHGSPNGHYAAAGNNGHANGHYAPAPGQEPRVYVTVPAPIDIVRQVERNVVGQLKVEGFYEKHSEMDIRFGSANFPDRPDDDKEDAGYYQSGSGRFWGALGWPFKTFWKMLIWPFVGGQERHQKEMSVVAVSLYPLPPGRLPRVDEILHRRIQPPSGHDAFSGFGTRSHSEPPAAPAPEPEPTPAPPPAAPVPTAAP